MDLSEFSEIIRDKEINEAEKLKAFHDFHDYYSQLVKSVLGNRRFTERQLSVDIFRKSWPEKQSETVFKKQLFSSYQTLVRIKNGIETGVVNKIRIFGVDGSSIDNFSDFLSIFSFDVFKLVEHAEFKYNNNKLNYRMGSSIGSSPRDIFENGSIMLHIKHFGADSIHFRDFFSYTVFVIRLMIEVAGKQILGFSSITDDKGDRIKRLRTQIAWDFIKYDQVNNKRIDLPIEIGTIQEIEKWTNRFIHTGYIQPIFLVENALVFLEKLRDSKSIEIFGYNNLKSEFESFVQEKMDEGQAVQVNWEHENHIGSKIVSM